LRFCLELDRICQPLGWEIHRGDRGRGARCSCPSVRPCLSPRHTSIRTHGLLHAFVSARSCSGVVAPSVALRARRRATVGAGSFLFTQARVKMSARCSSPLAVRNICQRKHFCGSLAQWQPCFSGSLPRPGESRNVGPVPRGVRGWGKSRANAPCQPADPLRQMMCSFPAHRDGGGPGRWSGPAGRSERISPVVGPVPSAMSEGCLLSSRTRALRRSGHGPNGGAWTLTPSWVIRSVALRGHSFM